MTTTFEFSISNQTVNGNVNLSLLQEEIGASEITIAISFIETTDDLLTIVFKTDLSAAEEIILNNVVTSHTAIEEQIIPVVTLKNTQADGTPKFAIADKIGKDVIYATHNFCDKTTWYSESIRVNQEMLINIDAGTVWDSLHNNWINLTHGKVFDEEGLIEDQNIFNPEDPHGYYPIIEVSSDAGSTWTTLTENSMYGSDGDYSIDYALGRVTFNQSQMGKLVRASYSYANTSCWILEPLAGTELTIHKGEIQFSADIDFTTSIIMQVLGYVESFAPTYWDQQEVVGITMFPHYDFTLPNDQGSAGDIYWQSTSKQLYQHNGTVWQPIPPGPLPGGSRVVIDNTIYKSLDQLIDESVGTFPVFPAMGGVTRGFTQDRHILQFHYGSAKFIFSSVGMQIKICTEHDLALGGERATATFYLNSEKDPANWEVFNTLGVT